MTELNFLSEDMSSEGGAINASNDSVVAISTPMNTPLISDSSSESSSPAVDPLESRRNLNTLFGVFCPVALSMFSACLFLRVGYLVGESGLLLTLVQLVLAYLLLVLTTLSVCAISTNGAIEGGGAYYMISRALGPEFGGALGMLFFWANIFSCALYMAGTVELVVNTFGPSGVAPFLPGIDQWWKYLYSTIFLFLNLIICILGGAVFSRASAITLLIVTVCAITVIISTFVKGPFCVDIPPENTIAHENCSNYTGFSTQTFVDNLLPQWSVDYTQPSAGVAGFGVVFAVLFSSVTGIMNGANMSGELKKPSYAIPHGTLYAICFTFIVYTIIMILTAWTSTHDLLINNFHYMQYVNLISWFVVIGSFFATFSAAAGNLIGASRYLEALADDEIFWGLLRFGRIRYRGNPWVAVLVTWGLIQIVTLINTLNQIAPLVTVCYLLMYTGTNLACLALEVASAPNFRPTFRYFSWHTCLLGVIGCLTMCFVVHALFAAVALALFLALLIILQFRNFEDHWGSISQAIIFHQVRKYLLLLDPRRDHVKFWRPQILLMIANPRSSCKLIDFVNDLKKSGLYVLGHVQVGEWDRFEHDPILKQQHAWIEVVKRMNVKAFVEITMAHSVREGLRHLVRLSGLGGMKPNTVVFGFYDDDVPVQALPAPSPPRTFLPKFLTARTGPSFIPLPERVTGSPIERPAHGRGRGSSRSQSAVSELDAALASLPPLRDRQRRLSEIEYVYMLWDVVKMNKNLVLCRNFAQFNKQPMYSSDKTKLLIDVWPIDPFNADRIDISGTSSMFLLQIACVLHMVRGWRSHSKLRFFLLEGLKLNDSSSGDSADVVTSVKKQLSELRIEGSVEVVSTRNTRSTANLKPADDSNGPSQDSSTFLHIPTSLISELNALMRSNSSAASVVFAQLPKMPKLHHRSAEEGAVLSKSYLDRLQLLTDGLPPTVLSLGLHTVTSSKL